MRMKFLFIVFVLFAGVCAANAADEKFLSCGPGYVLTAQSKADGVSMAECQKLWCRDLENGKSMGSDNSAATGYKSTGAPVQLCDADNNCIECFGDRRWCAGDSAGIWNPEYGSYTRGGADTAAYISYQKGDCFAWRLEKPECAAGETAFLRNGEWICATQSGTSIGSRESSIRRTPTLRRTLR